MRFSEFVGHNDAKLSLILNAIDRNCGGVIFIGEKGSGKSTLCRLFKEILPESDPIVEVPLNVTEEALLGFIDIEKTLKHGVRNFQEGILSRVDGGFLYIDDINLLPTDIVALILTAKEERKYLLEREGLSLVIPTEFVPIATMNPEEGMLSPHFLDKFGMCIFWDAPKEKDKRIDIIKAVCEDIYPRQNSSNDFSNFIKDLRKSVNTVKVPPKMQELMVKLCEEYGVSSHRGEIFLYYASRAFAAYVGAEEVKEEHIYTVLPLVLTHRTNSTPPELPPKDEEMEENPRQSHNHHHQHNEENHNPERGQRKLPPLPQAQTSFFENIPKEEIMEVGEAYKIRKLIFPKDKIERKGSGRRTHTLTSQRQGRYVKPRLKGNKYDIAIDATIRAAAPFQVLRGREDQIIINKEDLRYKRREKRVSHLFIFLVDASGSMGVNRRMVETKTAVRSILLDCYQKRDKVALIAFRKDKAEILLPPTSSVELADKRLAKLPVGGKTPLSAGLWEAFKLAKRERFKDPSQRITLLLITDGKANQSMGGKSIREEICRISFLLSSLPGIDFLVVDTEDKKGLFKTDLGLWIANLLGARYIQMEDLKAEKLLSFISLSNH
ncbi:MAG: VWA domain-containing protein [bacterium]